MLVFGGETIQSRCVAGPVTQLVQQRTVVGLSRGAGRGRVETRARRHLDAVRAGAVERAPVVYRADVCAGSRDPVVDRIDLHGLVLAILGRGDKLLSELAFDLISAEHGVAAQHRDRVGFGRIELVFDLDAFKKDDAGRLLALFDLAALGCPLLVSRPVAAAGHEQQRDIDAVVAIPGHRVGRPTAGSAAHHRVGPVATVLFHERDHLIGDHLVVVFFCLCHAVSRLVVLLLPYPRQRYLMRGLVWWAIVIPQIRLRNP